MRHDEYLAELRACRLCMHDCGADRLKGEAGVCRVGLPKVASATLHPAPPESYTVFTAGCNFKCLNCQNWQIAHYPDNGESIEGIVAPRQMAAACVRALDSRSGRRMGADRIFFSGGEPTIHLPYVEKVVVEARALRPGTRVNFDTNGFMAEDSLQRVLAFVTSITFDLKAFDDEVHAALTGAPAAPVLRNADYIGSRVPEKLWEFRIVVIPGLNDTEVPALCAFIAGIGKDLPVCFLAFRPNYVLEKHPGAPRELMEQCLAIAREHGLTHASWSGRSDLAGQSLPPHFGVADRYGRPEAQRAASYAAAAGCRTHPRDCSGCCLNQQCRLKRYRPVRVC